MAYLRLRYSITQYNVIRGAFHRSPPEIPRRHHESQSRFMRKSYMNFAVFSQSQCFQCLRPSRFAAGTLKALYLVVGSIIREATRLAA